MKRETGANEPPGKPIFDCVAEVVEGLETFAQKELARNDKVRIVKNEKASSRGEIPFEYSGDLRGLQRLMSVQAVYVKQHYEVPRPRGLLGDAHFRALLRQIEMVRGLWPKNTFESFYISAAGSESSVMQRIKEELSARIELPAGEERGDLLIRIRPNKSGGWETLIRLTPRPLATRSWRVCNLEGALNATVAHVMAVLTEPTPEDVYVNLGCGSGSLLIERLLYRPAADAVGVDHDIGTLRCAAANLAATGRESAASLLLADNARLPLPEGSVDVLSADLPFGQSVGSHEQNLDLYPSILSSAARVAKPAARFVLITHEVRLIESLLEKSEVWSAQRVVRITLRGLHPRIYLLRRL